jgi:hypothetical protein
MVLKPYIKTDTIGYRRDTITWGYYYPGGEPRILVDTVKMLYVHADLYPNGSWDSEELMRDVNHNGVCDSPSSGDRRWWELETFPFWFKERFDFDKNDFGISINSNAVTKNGVADVHLTYPRQLARRLFVTVNGEAKGVRDRDGERFVLPVIVGK